MKLNPQQAPLYGDCVVTVLLAEEDRVEEDVVFYLVFSGSALHHCASTRKVSSDTLETITPGHDCCETVKVLLCASRGGLPVSVVAEEDFRFIKDEAYDAAQFLATSAGNQQALNFTRFLDWSGPPAGDVNSLDEKVALAFRHLKLPAEWNVLGTDAALHDAGPRETLMHFAVRRGLLRLTWFLLQKPGGRGALSIHNQEGATPVSLALERGHHKLHQLLTQEDAGEPDSWSSLSYEIPYGECSVRHHRGLGVYTLTSGAEARQEPPAAEESCTGQIFKLMNIQQQLMKSNLGQMDNLLPLMVTAQDPCSAPSTPETDGCFLPGAPQPWGSQQLPLGLPQRAAHCQGGPAGQSDRARAPPSMAVGENPDQPCSWEAGVATKGEEAEPACAWDSRAVPGQDSCVACEPRCAVEGTEGSPSSGDSQGQHGREPGALKSGGVVMEPGPPWCPPGGVLAAGVAAGAAQQELEAVAAPTQEQVPRGREKDAAEGLGTSDAGAVGAAALGGGRPAASAREVSHGGSSVEKAAEAEAPGRRPVQNADVPVGHGCLVPAGALDDRIPGGIEPGIAPTAGLGEAAPCLDVGAPRAQQSEVNSCTGGGLQGAACAGAQGTVPPSGQSGAQHPRDEGPPSMPGASAAVGSADPQACPVPSRPAGETHEPEDDYPLGVLDEVGQRKELKRDTLSGNTLEVVSPPHDVVPETAEAVVPGQAVTSDSTVSLAGGPSSESGTRDDALCPVPSHGEKGAAAPRLHAAADGRERQDGEPGEPGEKGPSASGTAADLEPGMGNTSPAGLGGEPEGPGPSAHPEAVNAEGGPEAAPQSVGPAAWAAASAAAVEGKSSVAPESPVAPGQGDREEAATGPSTEEAATGPSTEEGTLPSGVLRAEQRTLAPGLELWAHSENSSSAARGEDQALQPCHSPGTPSAWLKTKNARDPEGAPRGSLLSEGGAAGGLGLPGAGLAAEQKCSPLSPQVRREGSEALSCELPLVRGVGVKTAPSQESVDPHGVRRNEPVGAAAAGAPQGPSGPGSKEFSHDSLDVPLPEVVLGMEKSVTQGLPEPVLGGVLMDVPGAASPDMPPADCREGWLEGADHSCAGCGTTETTMDGKAQRPVLQARPPEDEAPAGGLHLYSKEPTRSRQLPATSWRRSWNGSGPREP
ncbi:A-kinase anchor protein 13-like [Ochotona princeps]|uniref:A-kinase anchor protein 13-like n=1 Tax=Ochotona princeps TaxID=9978 RepID=UPI00271533EF|nr:A-kinase anchor protein 13-like [Ochotona princeps]